MCVCVFEYVSVCLCLSVCQCMDCRKRLNETISNKHTSGCWGGCKGVGVGVGVFVCVCVGG